MSDNLRTKRMYFKGLFIGWRPKTDLGTQTYRGPQIAYLSCNKNLTRHPGQEDGH